MIRLPKPSSALKLLSILFFSMIFLSGCSLPFGKKEVSGIQIKTGATSATIFLNGNKVGESPFSDQTLKPGTYTVKLQPKDQELVAYETSIELYPATLAVMDWNFGKTVESSSGTIYEVQPLKKKKDSNLTISSIPDGAIIKVDDASQGFTPLLMKGMTAGTHRYQVTLPSYKEQIDNVNIAEGFQMDVTVKLGKQKMTAPVESSSSAEASSSTKVATSSAKTSTTTKTATTSAAARSTTSTTSGKTVTIKETGTGWLRVRATPTSGGTELGKVNVGESYSFFEAKDGWYEIEYVSGKKGWVSAKYVSEN